MGWGAQLPQKVKSCARGGFVFAQQLQLVRTHAREDFGAQVQKMFLVKHVWALIAPLQHMVQSYANVDS